jgi:hypothetical protein
MFKKSVVVSLLILCLSTAVILPSASAAINLKDVLKGGLKIYGIGMLVDHFAVPLNKFINDLTAKHNLGTEATTKVVPIVSIGDGTHIGAAQVTGSDELVDQVKAVVQIEDEFNGGQFRIKALLPINSKNPIGASRIEGVGVSAVIDVKI